LFRVELTRKARRGIAALPDSARDRVLRAIHALGEEPRPRGVKKLRQRAQWRIRVGDYRVIYSIFDVDEVIVVNHVARRTTTTYD